MNEEDEISQQIKCKNYFICKHMLPPWWFSVRKSHFCKECNFKYNSNELHLKLNTYCPTCLYHKKCVRHLDCPHYLCIDCFKDFYTGQQEKNKCYLCRE
jgi:hypothetical protein